MVDIVDKLLSICIVYFVVGVLNLMVILLICLRIGNWLKRLVSVIVCVCRW